MHTICFNLTEFILIGESSAAKQVHSGSCCLSSTLTQPEPVVEEVLNLST